MVNIGPLKKYPPVITVLHYLRELGFELILCSTDIDNQTALLCKKLGIKTVEIKANYDKSIHPLLKLVRLIKIKKKLWNEIDKLYDSNTVIWVFSDLALKHLGRKLLGKRYVLQMFELNNKTLYYRKLPLLFINTANYAKNAVGVIQAENNRAHISKAWWGLDTLPYILPNKPYYNYDIPKKSDITNEKAKDIIRSLKNKKIILYQGIISPERPLEPFISAINRLGEDYAFVIMSGSENISKNIKSKNCYFLPFISPPLHLEVTSNAYIGILSYVPTKNEYSKLNSIYCAPNKLYEYSMFGIPMIGNNIPGLYYTFKTTGCGVCFDNFNEEEIIESIKSVELNYKSISENASSFYNKTNIKEILSNITSDIENQIFKS